ncbi:MAG: translocation/assembly module TamB domain-containing protein [Cyanobacteria bacterium SBC]|nr:translocation/assembly module TamB domain-containing protein [Cyanobacteria bacterium SBC]
MANLPPTPDSHTSLLDRARRLLRQATRPKTLAVVGGTVLIAGGLGYWGLQKVVRSQLPSLLETQLSQILNRSIEVGEVQGFSLAGIRLDGLIIPEAEDNNNRVVVEEIIVRYDILALLLGRLPLSLTLVNPEISAAQMEDGSWLNLELSLPEPEDAPEELPIDPQINLYIQDAIVRLVPQGQTTAFELDLSGTAQLRDELKLARYDLNVRTPQGEIELAGETQLETLASRLDTQVRQLDLAQFLQFLPPELSELVDIESGNLDANLKIDVPSLEWLLDSENPESQSRSPVRLVDFSLDSSKLPDIRGTLGLNDLSIDLEPLAQPLTAEGFLRFQGDRILLENVGAKTGTFAVKVIGSIDERTGYDIEVSVPPLPLQSLPDLVTIELPELPLSGSLQANVSVTGDIDNPKAVLALRNSDPLVIDRTTISEVRANLFADLSRIVLNGFRLTPAAGGQIVARGNADIRSLTMGTDDDPSIDVDVRVELPVDALLAPYGLPTEISIGTLTADAEANGTLDDPRAQLTWETPEIVVAAVGDIATFGEVRFRGNRVSLETAEVRVGDGSIVATGEADLDLGEWVVDASSTPIDLAPFLPLPLSVSLTGLTANASGSLDNIDPNMVGATASLDLAVEEGTVNVQADAFEGNLAVVTNAAGISANTIVPDLPVSVALLDSTATVTSSIDALLLAAQTQDVSDIDVTANANLAVADGTVTADARVSGGNVTAIADVSSISVSSIVPDLPVPVALLGATARVETSVDSLLAAAQTQDLNGVAVVADASIAVADGTANARVGIANGSIDTTATVSSISVSSIVPEIPIPVVLLGATAQASLTIDELLTAAQTQDFTGLNPSVRADAQLAAGDGTADVTATVDRRQWNVATTAGLTVTDALVAQLVGGEILTSPRFPAPLTAVATLSGSIDPLLSLGERPVFVNVDGVSVQLAEESIDTQGTILLTGLTTSPDLATDLSIEATYHSDRLPLSLLIAEVFVGETLDRPNAVNIAGRVDFNGRLRGQNLISNPLAAGSLDLTGDLQLRNFAVNDIAFDPALSGDVLVRTGDSVSIDLRGTNDRIAARLDPCNRGTACLFPYLPTGFELRQGEDTETPIVALGERMGDILDVRLQNFDLALLNVVPGEVLGIDGDVEGDVTAAISADLFTLESRGTLAIDRPGVGYIQADTIAAEFGYDNATAWVNDAYLQLGDNRFTLTGQTEIDILGLLRGEVSPAEVEQAPITAQLTVENGSIGDILSTFAWYGIEDIVARGVGTPSLSAADLNANPVGVPSEPLFDQVRVFAKISELVERQAEQLRQPSPPRLADVRGSYNAQVAVGGTLARPEVEAVVSARGWEWHTQPAFAAINDTLGFFIEENSTILIEEIVARARYRDDVLTVDAANLEIDGAQMSFVGELSPTAGTGTFELANLNLSTVQNFVEFPIDLNGRVNARGEIGGSLEQPEIEGRVVLDSPTLNGRPMDAFVGDFRYGNDVFEFATVAPSWIEATARVPFPWTETERTARARVTLDTPAFELVNALSNGQVAWLSGDGSMRLDASVDLIDATSGDFDALMESLSANGEVVLEDVTVQAAALPQAEAQIDGRVLVDEDRVSIDNLIAQVADGTFSIAGTLPFLTPEWESDNPLTLKVENGNIDLSGLYRGQIDGFVAVRGTALTPVVSGEIALSEGRVSVPMGGEVVEGAIPMSTVWTAEAEKSPPPVIPILQDFRVVLGEDFRIRNSFPQFNFRIEGELVVNGALDGNLENLTPEGKVSIARGQINLFSSLFFVAPGHEQTVTFVPENGLLNPELDLQLATLIYEERRNRLLDRDRDSNEVPDLDLLPTRQSRQLLVSVTVDSTAQELLDALLASNEESGVSAIEDSQLLRTVALTSVPERSERELVALLGGQVLTTIDQVANLRGTELFEFAFVRFVVEPTITEWLLDVDRVANRVGQSIGLDRLSVFPPGQIEAIYELDDRSLLGLTYDYGVNGLLLQGAGRDEDSNPGFNYVELRYEFRF